MFELTDDLLDPRTACGAPVRIRKGNETYRITRVNIFDATGEVEIECEDDVKRRYRKKHHNGNAVVRPRARLMLQRGLTAINHERNL